MGRKSKRIPEIEERNAEMYRLYSLEGWSTRDVADEFGLHPGRVRKIFKKRGWPMRKPGGRGHREWRLLNEL